MTTETVSEPFAGRLYSTNARSPRHKDLLDDVEEFLDQWEEDHESDG